MTSIELSAAQRQALLNEHGKPLDVVDPISQEHYVLLAWELYQRMAILEHSAKPANGNDIPSGILCSQQAFWRDLPQLLQERKNHGRWVCYHGNERVGIGSTERELIRECRRRGLPRGLAVYPDGTAFPPLPLLGLRALVQNKLHVAIDSDRCLANVRTSDWRTRLWHWLS